MVTQEMQESPDMSWFSSERKNWLAVVGLAACIGYWCGNGHTTQNAIQDIASQQGQTHEQLVHVQKVVIPTLQKKAAEAQAQKQAVVTAVVQHGDADDLPASVRPK